MDAQELFGKLVAIKQSLSTARQANEDLMRLATNGIVPNSTLERLDSALLALEDLRKEIRNG